MASAKFEIEDLGEQDQDEYSYYSEGEGDEGFQVEVDMGNGRVQKIDLTEEEYTKIFDEGQQDLLVKIIKELQIKEAKQASLATDETTL